MSKLTQFSSTCGRMASHKNFSQPKLIRVQYLENEDCSKITLRAVSGHSLGRVCAIPAVTMTIEQYRNEAVIDSRDDYAEDCWAFEKLGMSI